MSEKQCKDCNHSVWDDNGACIICACFKHDGTCAGCEQEIISIKDHTCDQCECLKCDCNCPPPVKETKTISLTYEVKVAIHEYSSGGWDIYDSLEEAIKDWDFGNPRAGAHHWDQSTCHVAQNKNGKWILIYM